MSEFDNLDIMFKCQFGSHLYGTNTPESDVDIKGVYVESIENILLKKDKSTIVHSTGNDESRNSRDDIDIEFKELRFFLKEAMQGQTYAIDMLFCNEKNELFKDWRWEYIVKNREKLLSKNILPFIGYCRHQAAKYGLKGSRLGELERVITALSNFNIHDKISEIQIKESEFVKFVEKNNEKFLEVLGKKYQVSKTVKAVLESLQIMWDKYGDRAKLAKENNGVDWKAVSHAYRCMYQVKSLLVTGEIVFPLKEANYIKEIKAGCVAWDNVNIELPLLMQSVEKCVDLSPLPGKPDKEFWDRFVLDVYNVRGGSSGSSSVS